MKYRAVFYSKNKSKIITVLSAAILLGFYGLRCVGTLSGEATQPFSFFFAFFLIESQFQRKEFAPIGANSFF